MKNHVSGKTAGWAVFMSALAIGVSSPVRPVRAGWSGSMTGNNIGWSYSWVRSVTGSQNTAATSSGISNPTACIPCSGGYQAWNSLPSGACSSSTARVNTYPGCVFSPYIKPYNGDGADNPELESRVVVNPASCPELSMENDPVVVDANTGSGVIAVTTKGTAGTALWLRGFEWVGDPTTLPGDDLTTVQNETAEFLKQHGVLKFEALILGPFEYGNDKCKLLIPFTLETKDVKNLVFLTDGVAKSTKFQLICPPDQIVSCGQTDYRYPNPEATGTCSTTINVTFSPEEKDLVVGDNTVTATATDGTQDVDGNPITATCKFKVTKADNGVPTIIPPPDLLDVPTGAGVCYASNVSLGTPTTSDDCGVASVVNNAPAKFPKGTTQVTWTVTDLKGKIATAVQTVVVKDKEKPVPPTLAKLTGGCGQPVTVPVPYATDNCDGSVKGTTTLNNLTFSAPGTYTVPWTFTDLAGNSLTVNQAVEVTTSGLTFIGFFSPIDGTGGGCGANGQPAPLRNINRTSNLAIKFETKCGSTFYTSGQIAVEIQRYDNCSPVGPPVKANATPVANDWHYNWTTKNVELGIYRIIVTLQDNTTREVFVKLQ